MFLAGEQKFLKPTPKLRELLVLLSVDENPSISQNALALQLGLVPSMINKYIKTLVAQELIMQTGPTRRSTEYRLTDKAKSRKLSLLIEYSTEIMRLYINAREEFIKRLKHISSAGVRTVVFFGAGGTAEVVFHSLERSGLELVGVVDNDTDKHGQLFCGFPVMPPDTIEKIQPDGVLITSFKHQDNIYSQIKGLEKKGIKVHKI